MGGLLEAMKQASRGYFADVQGYSELVEQPAPSNPLIIKASLIAGLSATESVLLISQLIRKVWAKCVNYLRF